MYYAKEIVNQLKQSRQTAVFGAGVMALGVVNCLTAPPYGLQIECCLISDKKKNPRQVWGIPVLDFGEAESVLRKDALVIVAAVDKNLESMEESLYSHGYHHILPLTYEGDLWMLLRGNLYREERLSKGKSYITLEEALQEARVPALRDIYGDTHKKISIYTAMCHVDRPLSEDISRYFWEIPIQVGAALTDKEICEIRDDTGDHISHKNRQYCELTALYWIWKNDKSDYVGLGHYRRHLELEERDLKKLACSDVDVVLTIPIFDVPSVGEVYRRDHVAGDWDVMLRAIGTLCPEYLSSAREMEAGRFYYAYNMFIMRREILEPYCQWLFPLLSYCEEHCAGEREGYQGRYIGFLAEHLMSVYFLHHEKEYKIVHARKHFIGK